VTSMSNPGALLMTYGSPDSVEPGDVRAYLARVRHGREPDDELVDEFTRRYRVIGGSPLIPITESQAAALAEELGWPVEVGMRFSEPSIETGLRRLAAAGVTHVAAIILSPQHSPLLMSGYGRAIDAGLAAIAASGDAVPRVAVADAWHTEPRFIEALASRLRAALESAEGPPGRAHVLMTAHSLPRRVADEEPGYLDQVESTALAIARQAGLAAEDWTFCWQSAGHEPGEWMKPDFADLMPRIAAAGATRAIVVPVQFLADHLETLYDVDVGAREQAEAHGLAFERVASLNDDPGLIAALAEVARRTASAAGRSMANRESVAAPSR
jgi:protoporphyrin/coproporphyrin ferrochelatase